MRLLKRLYQWVKEKCIHVFDLKDRPHAIALGAGLGMFWGFTPFLGLKTLLAMGTARLFKGNVVAGAVAVQLHDITIPIAPALLLWEYKIGCWILSQPHEWPVHSHFKASELLHWHSLFTVGQPLIIGSLFVAVPLGLLTYWPMLAYLVRRNARKAAEAELTAVTPEEEGHAPAPPKTGIPTDVPVP